MSTRSLYLVQGISRRRQSITSGVIAQSSHSYVTDDPKGRQLQVALRATACGVNGTMFAGVPPPDEGADAPFWRRGSTASEGVNWRQQAYVNGLRNANEGWAGLPLPILELPYPDEGSTDVPFLRRYYTASEGVSYRDRAAQRRSIFMAGEKTAWGIFPERLPATGYDINLCQFLSEIKRHMLEPDTSGATDFQLWTRAEVLSYLNNRLAKFMHETHLVVTLDSLDPSEELYPADTIEVLRASWVGDDGTRASLQRTDRWQADMGLSGWGATSGTPYAIIEQPKPSLKYKLVPEPDQDGTLEIVYVANPAEMSTCADILPIPSMFTWAIKWGVIADMLYKQGEANDPIRAEAAQKRWELGVALAKTMLGTEEEKE